MAMKVLLLCILVAFAIGAEGKSDMYRKPLCGSLSDILACPLNLNPVCGTDGNTYANECLLCVQKLTTNKDILIQNDGNC